VNLADDKKEATMRPYLADTNELCIQVMGVDHVVIAAPTQSSYYRGLFNCCTGFWPKHVKCLFYPYV